MRRRPHPSSCGLRLEREVPATSSSDQWCAGCRGRLKAIWQGAVGPVRAAEWQAGAAHSIALTDTLGFRMEDLEAEAALPPSDVQTQSTRYAAAVAVSAYLGCAL